MKFDANQKPEYLESLGVLGHLIVVNQQVYNLQEMALEEYINKLNINTLSILH